MSFSVNGNSGSPLENLRQAPLDYETFITINKNITGRMKK